jgi:hypothetical protein
LHASPQAPWPVRRRSVLPRRLSCGCNIIQIFTTEAYIAAEATAQQWGCCLGAAMPAAGVGAVPRRRSRSIAVEWTWSRGRHHAAT